MCVVREINLMVADDTILPQENVCRVLVVIRLQAILILYCCRQESSHHSYRIDAYYRSFSQFQMSWVLRIALRPPTMEGVRCPLQHR